MLRRQLVRDEEKYLSSMNDEVQAVQELDCDVVMSSIFDTLITSSK